MSLLQRGQKGNPFTNDPGRPEPTKANHHDKEILFSSGVETSPGNAEW